MSANTLPPLKGKRAEHRRELERRAGQGDKDAQKRIEKSDENRRQRHELICRADNGDAKAQSEIEQIRKAEREQAHQWRVRHAKQPMSSRGRTSKRRKLSSTKRERREPSLTAFIDDEDVDSTDDEDDVNANHTWDGDEDDDYTPYTSHQSLLRGQQGGWERAAEDVSGETDVPRSTTTRASNRMNGAGNSSMRRKQLIVVLRIRNGINADGSTIKAFAGSRNRNLDVNTDDSRNSATRTALRARNMEQDLTYPSRATVATTLNVHGHPSVPDLNHTTATTALLDAEAATRAEPAIYGAKDSTFEHEYDQEDGIRPVMKHESEEAKPLFVTIEEDEDNASHLVWRPNPRKKHASQAGQDSSMRQPSAEHVVDASGVASGQLVGQTPWTPQTSVDSTGGAQAISDIRPGDVDLSLRMMAIERRKRAREIEDEELAIREAKLARRREDFEIEEEVKAIERERLRRRGGG